VYYAFKSLLAADNKSNGFGCTNLTCLKLGFLFNFNAKVILIV